GGIPQRWLVLKDTASHIVESEARAESDRQSLEKKITKEKEIVEKKVAKLFKKTFDNATEAELSLKQIQSKLTGVVIIFLLITRALIGLIRGEILIK
ncbi:MAG: hypothetical protein WBM86_12940, partial [Waterburya sp.]